MATAYKIVDEPRPERGGPLPGPARFTADEFLRMDALGAFAGHKVELSDGQLMAMPLPGWFHAELQSRLAYLLHTAVGTGSIALGELTVRLGPTRVRDLDGAVGRRDARKPGPVLPEALLLAIEIADTTPSFDLSVKAREYSEAGIGEYWVCDVQAEVVHVMQGPSPDGYARRTVVRFDEPLTIPGGAAIVIAENA